MTLNEKEQSQKPKLSSTVAVALGAIVAGGLVKVAAYEASQARELTKEEALVKAVNDIRKTLPIKTDENTIFVNAMADTFNMTFIYEYIIENTPIKNDNQKQSIASALRKNLMQICNNESAFKNGVNFKWKYLFPSSGEDIQIAIKDTDCKNSKK